jgi:GNAT superfamily N-acetyltransferase
MDIRIEQATADDAEQIGVFQTRAWGDTYRGMVPDSYLDATTTHTRAERWRNRLESGQRRAWLALTADGLVGVASTSPTPNDRPDLPPLELSSIYVDKSVLGRGVARELLNATIGEGAAHLWVFIANTRAQRFYAKHGFVATGETQADSDTGVMEVRWVRARLPLEQFVAPLSSG